MQHAKSLNSFKVIALAAVVLGLLAGSNPAAVAAPHDGPHKKTTGGHLSGRAQDGGGRQVTFKASLVDPEKKARRKEATVRVEVTGVELVDPASVNEQPKAGQGHLHYQVDDGPVIATTAAKLSFHGLTSGRHRIVVTLAANDHSPAGQQETLTVTIP